MPNKITVETQSQNFGIFMFGRKSDVPYIVLGALTMILASLGSPIQTYIYGKTFLKLSKFLFHSYNSPSDFLNEIRVLCVGIMGVGIGRMILTWISIYAWLQVGEKHQARARMILLNLMIHKEFVWFDSKINLMGTIAQVNRSIEEIRDGVSENVAMLVQVTASIIFLFINAMISLWSLTLVVMVSAPLMAICAYIFGNKTFKSQKLENDFSSQASKVLNWSFVNGDLVRLLNGKYVDMVKFNKFVDLSAKAFKGTALSIAGNGSILRLLSNCLFVQGFLFGAYMMRIGKLSIDQLFTAFSSCLLFGGQLSAIAVIIALLNKAKAAAFTIATSEILEIEDVKQNDDCFASSYKDKFSDQQLKLYNVSFRYDSSTHEVLKDINATFDASEINFIIGESGSGKSTLVLLLMNFYAPTKGEILIGDTSTLILEPHELFEVITLVETNPLVFDDLLLRNLQFNDEFLSEQRVLEACKFARLDKFITSQPEGIHTKLSSSSLSGGQIQRVGLARAWLKDSPIIIFDESLSALDSKSLKEIVDDIRSWRQGKITIFITHRKLDIKSNDKVTILEKGRIVFRGYGGEMSSQDFDQKTSLIDSDDASVFSYSRESKVKSRISDYLHNPHILKDLEERGPHQEHEPQLLGIFAIVRFCFATIQSKIMITVGLVLSLFSGFFVPLISYFVSKLLSTAITSSYAIEGTSRLMLKFSLVVIGISIVDATVFFCSQVALDFSLENWIVELRKNTMALIDEQDMLFFRGESRKPAELTALLMNDSRDLRVLISEFLALVILLMALTIFGIAWSIASGWKLALVGIAFVPLTLFITVAYGIVLSRVETTYKEKVVDVENFSHNAISGIRTVRAFGLHERVQQEMEKKLDKLCKVGKARAFFTGFGVALLELCTSLATGTILYYGMTLVAAKKYNQSQLLEVLTMLTFTLTSASSLMHKLPEVARGKRSGLRLFWLSKLEKLFIETNGSQIPLRRGGSPIIAFEKVDFSFPNNVTSSYKRILRNISFDIRSGETVAIVGKSGSGKSTIVLLLGRLYEQDRGIITYCNKAISDLEVEWYRRAVVVVPQHPSFFEGSILQNLTYGVKKSAVDSSTIWKCLEECQIADFVRNLPHGLDEVIGEGMNAKASTGQLQRLSICRGLIRNPDVLILDECTANLDETNGNLIFNQIRANNSALTIIMVTHDVNVMKIASRIMMLDKGTIIEDGIFEELYQNKRCFYNLIK